MKRLSALIAQTAFALALLGPSGVATAQTPAPSQNTNPASGKAKPAANPAPTPQQIADAKAKGLVWVNLNTRVYHKSDSMYGATKNGKFMTEADATKAGYRAAKESGTPGKKASATK